MQRLRHLRQDQDGRIAHPVFEVGDVALRDVCRACERLARHAAAPAQRAHPLAQRNQQGVLGRVVRGIGGRHAIGGGQHEGGGGGTGIGPDGSCSHDVLASSKNAI